MNVKIKMLKNGMLPIKKTEGAAAYDVYSAEDSFKLFPGETRIVKLGFCVEVPEGYYLEVRGRSGLSSIGLLCHTGTVDSDYRGEVGAILSNVTSYPIDIKKEDRVAQIMLKSVTDINFVLFDNLSETVRGKGGFGSTGR